MGAKAWMLVYGHDNAKQILSQYPKYDRQKTDEILNQLYPGQQLKFVNEVELSEMNPSKNEIIAGYFGSVFIIASDEFSKDNPSKLDPKFLHLDGFTNLYLHAMHSVVDFFAYGVWEKGNLTRSLSLSPESNIIEDIGTPLDFEKEYWQGKYPAVDSEEDEYPLPFHPLDLAEESLKFFLGYQLEGNFEGDLIEVEDISLARYKIKKPIWKLW